MKENRREFLKQMAGLSAGLVLPLDSLPERDRIGKLLPTRLLGKTDKRVTMLGLGGSHVGRNNARDAQSLIETALEGGIRFFDNAESYNGGRAEEYYGKFLSPNYRDVAFIMTKSTATTSSLAKRHLEESLKRLNTDYVDLWQIHSVRNPGDVDNRIAQGVLEVAIKAKEEGKAKHIGFTGHTAYQAHQRMLEKQSVLETCQMPINVFDMNYKSFIKNVMPELIQQKYGIIAMKTLSNGGFFGGTSHFQHGPEPKIVPNKLSIKEALYFVWSLPVSVLVTGADNDEMLKEKIDLAKNFYSYSRSSREELIERVAEFDGRKVEYYKS